MQALGIDDFGLFSAIGSIITFMAIFNTVLVQTSNRYIAVAIGRGNMEEVNMQFNVNLVVHILIALFTLLIAIPLGNLYIYTFFNYPGDIVNAYYVFNVSAIASVITFVGVPYNGLMMAKERFLVFSMSEMVMVFLRTLIVWSLVYYFNHKLFIYTFIFALSVIVPVVVNVVYCYRNFPRMVAFKFVRERKLYEDVLNFSKWVLLGAVCLISRNQGSMLIVNAFFTTAMNAALGIANSINSYISLFAQSIAQPIAPQITKNYAAGNRQRTDELLVLSTKYSFYAMLLVSVPFLVSSQWILSLWLGKVPPYATIFVIFLIIDNLIQSFNSGINNIIFASGKIRMYQIGVSLLNLFSLIMGYLALTVWTYPYVFMYVYILLSVVKVVMLQVILHKTLNYDNRILVFRSYIPSLIIVALFLPAIFLPSFGYELIRIILSMLYLSILIWMIGLKSNERASIRNKAFSILRK